MILEAPPGFEPGMEVLQGHPRVVFADFLNRVILAKIGSSQSHRSIRQSARSWVALPEIGWRQLAAGTFRAQLMQKTFEAPLSCSGPAIQAEVAEVRWRATPKMRRLPAGGYS